MHFIMLERIKFTADPFGVSVIMQARLLDRRELIHNIGLIHGVRNIGKAAVFS